MRFYKGSHEYLHKVNEITDVFDQFLFLVPEVDNVHDINAVMLHNGHKKLGSVEARSAAAIKRLMVEWQNASDSRSEDIVVCRIEPTYRSSLEDFKYRGSITVRGMYRVNERLARKFAKLNLKD
jgi:hypothetical protein